MPVAVVHPGVGAPLAAAFLEELIPRGGRAFVACGGAGVLVPELAVGHVMVPTTAVRDEGTSYHYLPASRTVDPSPVAQAAILDVLRERDVPFVEGATWTTDATLPGDADQGRGARRGRVHQRGDGGGRAVRGGHGSAA